MSMKQLVFNLMISGYLALMLIPHSVGYEVNLVHLSTVYLATYDAEGKATYPFPSVVVEQLAYDPSGKIIYAVGYGNIQIIDATDINNLQYMDHIDESLLDLTSIEVCNDTIIISYSNNSNPLQGGVKVMRPYNRVTKTMELLHDIPMGSLPDKVLTTQDCTIVVAMENEGFVLDNKFYDLPGAIGIIRFTAGFANKPEVKSLDFSSFDDKFGQLSKHGVRWVYRGNNSFSHNIEPEYIAFSSDYTKAYIGLQENNAIAVVDMISDQITDIYGLGFKQWENMDASDKDGGIHIREWSVFGMYQPDSIVVVHWNGQDYIITANEGDSQKYPAPINFTEEIRAKRISSSDIAKSVPASLKQAVHDDTMLGRLLVSSVDGKDDEGKYEKFYSYGGRSFSVWRATDMKQVYDSGSELEEKIAELRPDIFNSYPKAGATIKDTLDLRSDNSCQTGRNGTGV